MRMNKAFVVKGRECVILKIERTSDMNKYI